jgi:hypothetical protein
VVFSCYFISFQNLRTSKIRWGHEVEPRSLTCVGARRPSCEPNRRPVVFALFSLSNFNTPLNTPVLTILRAPNFQIESATFAVTSLMSTLTLFTEVITVRY